MSLSGAVLSIWALELIKYCFEGICTSNGGRNVLPWKNINKLEVGHYSMALMVPIQNSSCSHSLQVSFVFVFKEHLDK